MRKKRLESNGLDLESRIINKLNKINKKNIRKKDDQAMNSDIIVRNKTTELIRLEDYSPCDRDDDLFYNVRDF